MELKSPETPPLPGELEHAINPVERMPVPPKYGQKLGNTDTLNPCLTPSSSWGMGPGGRRPSHLSAEDQIAPTSGLVNRRASHLLQNLVALSQSCEGPSKCNEATWLCLLWEGMPPQCNGGLFTQKLADPQGPKGGRQLACPPLTSGGLVLEEGVWGRTSTYSTPSWSIFFV